MLCVRRCWMVVGAMVRAKLSAAIRQYWFPESDPDAETITDVGLSTFLGRQICIGRMNKRTL
jgi:hypothetical protein